MKKETTLIILILIAGLTIRLLRLNQLPISPNWDEVSHGYNAFSILKTSKDEWGSFLPIIFRAYGDYKLPFYIYLTTIPVAIFGLNVFSIRLISALAGTLTGLFIFLIAKEILGKKSIIPLIISLIFLFSPFNLFLSRIALEANLFLLLFSISLYLAINQKLALSSFFYGLALFTYNSSRVLLPFYLLLFIFLAIKNKYKLSKNWYKLIPFLVFVGLTLFQTFQQAGQARYQWVSILDSGSINQINELRQHYPRFIANKATYFTFTVIKNYLNHFNPQFLFFSGGSNYQFNIPNFYLISPLFLPFFILGLFFIIKNIKNINYQIILFLFLISPIPSSITRDAPHVLRSICFPFLAILIIGIGLFHIKKFPRLISITAIVIVLLTQIIFWPKYKIYAKEYSFSWQFGYQQASDFIKENYSKYDKIIITKKYGEAHEFILFYLSFDPSNYQNNPKKWDYHTNWYWVDSFDKFEFINDWEIQDKTKDIGNDQNTLLITSPGNYNKDSFTPILSIEDPNQKMVFDILKNKNETQK